MSEAEAVIAWANAVASGGVYPDAAGGATMTVFLGAQSAGRPVKLEFGKRSWHGVVDSDGVALLTRSDLLPR